MSHWSLAETPIKNIDLLKKGAEKVGLKVETGNVVARGYGRRKERVDAVIRGNSYDIGFKWSREKGKYDVIADVWGWETEKGRGSYKKTMDSLVDRYTSEEMKKVARAKGHMIHETVEEDGTIRLRVRTA